ncbi:DUF899 domain-containing protein [Microvirga alba]|uniref:Thioredoxin family protein n=1 Tax=Microvirga alba TaxID=2791025 RepID=A0A931FQ73_9HYPH|nr:thioredoxin family protein [Microvirga alba]MBF9233183.1 thioredoxin family protein [Microvirga alba]
MQHNRIVSQEEWVAARKALLAREKEFTHFRDKLNEERMALPWVKVEKDYVFDTPTGRKTLAELFDGRSQLMVYHFMFGPGWEAGCPSCSLLADHFGGALIHLNHHDVTLMAVSRATLHEIEAYRKRMGWRFPWASSSGNDFNYDYHVSFTKDQLANGPVLYNFASLDAANAFEELPGLSAFYRDDAGNVFHTYSTYARGLEEMLGAFMFLDRAPKGRNETTIMDWVRRHDEYEAAANLHACCGADG